MRRLLALLTMAVAATALGEGEEPGRLPERMMEQEHRRHRSSLAKVPMDRAGTRIPGSAITWRGDAGRRLGCLA